MEGGGGEGGREGWHPPKKRKKDVEYARCLVLALDLVEVVLEPLGTVTVGACATFGAVDIYY